MAYLLRLDNEEMISQYTEMTVDSLLWTILGQVMPKKTTSAKARLPLIVVQKQ